MSGLILKALEEGIEDSANFYRRFGDAATQTKVDGRVGLSPFSQRLVRLVRGVGGVGLTQFAVSPLQRGDLAQPPKNLGSDALTFGEVDSFIQHTTLFRLQEKLGNGNFSPDECKRILQAIPKAPDGSPKLVDTFNLSPRQYKELSQCLESIPPDHYRFVKDLPKSLTQDFLHKFVVEQFDRGLEKAVREERSAEKRDLPERARLARKQEGRELTLEARVLPVVDHRNER